MPRGRKPGGQNYKPTPTIKWSMPKAYCHGSACKSPSNGALKDVTRSEAFCPECGHALLWKAKSLKVKTKLRHIVYDEYIYG